MSDFIFYPAEYKQLKRSYVEYSYEVNGKMHRVRKYFDRVRNKASREKQGRAYARRINNQLEKGWRPDSQLELTAVANTNLKAALANVLQVRQKHLRHKSELTYQAHFRQLMNLISLTCGDKVVCGQFGRAEASAIMDKLVLTRKIGETTFNNYLRNYRGWFGELVDRGHFQENPFRHIKKKRAKKPQSRVFTENELKRLVEHLKKNDRHFYYACALLYYCGIRRSELVGLRVENVNDRLVHVPAEVAKNGKGRTRPMPEELAQELAAELESYPSQFYVFGRGVRVNQEPAHPNRITERFAEHRAILRIDTRKKFYGLKDTAAKRLSDSGIDHFRLRDFFDHSDVSVTDAYMKRIEGHVDLELADIFPKLG